MNRQFCDGRIRAQTTMEMKEDVSQTHFDNWWVSLLTTARVKTAGSETTPRSLAMAKSEPEMIEQFSNRIQHTTAVLYC